VRIAWIYDDLLRFLDILLTYMGLGFKVDRAVPARFIQTPSAGSRYLSKARAGLA
jgi:hypothetical protein